LLIKSWQCYFWVTDGYCVYKNYINPEDHIVSKTYMTRVEGENTRLRHYLAMNMCNANSWVGREYAQFTDVPTTIAELAARSLVPVTTTLQYPVNLAQSEH
jgi:hypothetical protein